jgi:hypothetical protein
MNKYNNVLFIVTCYEQNIVVIIQPNISQSYQYAPHTGSYTWMRSGLLRKPNLT